MTEKIHKANPISIKKKTTIKGFTQEEELKYLVERGDWELVVSSKAFLGRSSEGKAQLVQEAIDVRIEQLKQSLYHLVNRGPEYQSASMAVIQRTKDLERIRDEILKQIYDQYTRAIPDKDTGKKYY